VTQTAERLDGLYKAFDHVTSATDPVHIVRRFTTPEDREIVGFCAAGLAFGRVASVLQSIESLLVVMGPHPARFVRDFDSARERDRLAPLVHRWIRGRDLMALLLEPDGGREPAEPAADDDDAHRVSRRRF